MNTQPQTSISSDIESSDSLVAGADPSIEIFLRNKRLRDSRSLGSLLLVHGATFPSVSLFDTDLGGTSFMDVLARAGVDVWALDVRGYGGSTRPAVMDGAPADAAPVARATEAVDDVAQALAHIRALRRPPALGLLGMSWGGSIAGMQAARDADLDALVLVAPLWLSATPLRFDAGAAILSHRMVDVSTFEKAWLSSAPEAARARLLPPGWFDRWRAVTEATDQLAPDGVIRAPSGAVADVREHWTAGRPLYDPARINAPTMVIRGTWDVDVRRDMALDLFDRLSGASTRGYLEVAQATHMMLLEPARDVAFAHVRQFVTNAFIAAANGSRPRHTWQNP